MSTIRDHAGLQVKKRRPAAPGGEASDGLKKFRHNGAASGAKTAAAAAAAASQPVIKASAAGRERAGRGEAKPQYVQEAIHKEVQYARKGQRSLPPLKRKVVAFVEREHLIPEDFDMDHKFGPLSGTSHEERVLSAYMAGLLQPRPDRGNGSAAAAAVEVDGKWPVPQDRRMCFECGERGHFPRYCPSKPLE